MIAIHNSNSGFHPRWVAYCEEKNIPYKLVNCYDDDLVMQLEGCDALMWHHHHLLVTDLIVSKSILFALEHSGIQVFPNFNTNWHFDDKVGQKYLLEAIKAPIVKSHVFYSQEKALLWANTTTYPKVFKLRGGAGSRNVRLVKNLPEARKVISKAFSKGISNYSGWDVFKEEVEKYRKKQSRLIAVFKSFARVFWRPSYADINGRERGYVYFQDFIPDNEFDIRIIVIGDKAFGLKRYVRNGDFRASGSGDFGYAREEFDERCVKISFEIAKKLRAQSVAFDFVFDENNNPLIVEISYGFSKEVYDPCPGYWTNKMDWVDGFFNPQGWMVDLLRAENCG